MDSRREDGDSRDEGPSPKRPRLRGSRGGRRVRSGAAPPALQQDQNMMGASANQQGGDNIPEERMAAVLARYKAWINQGSPHDPYCFKCNKGGDVVPCDTCPRQYHEACKPEVNATVVLDNITRWYCPVCVGFGWHTTPPILTPPASPVSSSIEVAPVGQNSRPLVGTTPTQTSSRQSPATNQSPPSLRAPASGARKRQQKVADAPNTITPDTVHRKSRFNTLPEEVDSALTTLYRELENIPFLQKKVSDLESELARVRQVLDMQRNELTMARRMAEKARISDVELQRLKEEAASKQAAFEEKEELKAKNKELESEVGTLRDELETATKTLQEWKQKLSNMIGS